MAAIGREPESTLAPRQTNFGGFGKDDEFVDMDPGTRTSSPVHLLDFNTCSATHDFSLLLFCVGFRLPRNGRVLCPSYFLPPPGEIVNTTLPGGECADFSLLGATNPQLLGLAERDIGDAIPEREWESGAGVSCILPIHFGWIYHLLSIRVHARYEIGYPRRTFDSDPRADLTTGERAFRSLFLHSGVWFPDGFRGENPGTHPILRILRDGQHVSSLCRTKPTPKLCNWLSPATEPCKIETWTASQMQVDGIRNAAFCLANDLEWSA
ncbi:hypothetical protein BDV26DRAFT_125882 [Aspergillus bertholletiae]|uniref:Uncharacterized protein n=1 Tax=Aspergillus bertholletiae TaxID=1226010 RepID=A0A5N7AR91_9EURO|nr:hypothetical protein BDV26DRAFT_125882 [Aspergillus bertholletiae]